MNYEEKYKKALERANAKIETYYNLGNTTAAKSIEEIFPELADSENEKIRKGLIQHLQELRKSHVNLMTKDTYDCWISWLENQGEQKPVEWSEDEKWNTQVFCNALDLYKEPVDKIILKSWLKSLKDRVLQKQEWSNEDKSIIHAINEAVESYWSDDAQAIVKIQTWFKSLRSHFKPTEEQMEALLFAEGYVRGNDADELAGKLASLYEQLKTL